GAFRPPEKRTRRGRAKTPRQIRPQNPRARSAAEKTAGTEALNALRHARENGHSESIDAARWIPLSREWRLVGRILTRRFPTRTLLLLESLRVSRVLVEVFQHRFVFLFQ